MRILNRLTPHKRAWLVLLVFFVIYNLLSRILAFFGVGEYIRAAIGQIVTIIPIASVFVHSRNVKPKPFFRLRKISLRDFWLWFFFGICACCAFTLINIPVANFWKSFTAQVQNVTPPANIFEYLTGIVCIAFVPAVCEELLCRGIVVREYELYSKKTAVIVSAMAFSLLHNSAPMLVYTFLIGLVLAFVVEQTESIYPAMIIHFAINFFSLTVNYLSNSVVPMHMQPEFALIVNLIFVFLALIFALLMFTLLKNRSDVLTGRNPLYATHKYGLSISMIFVIILFIISQLQ